MRIPPEVSSRLRANPLRARPSSCESSCSSISSLDADASDDDSKCRKPTPKDACKLCGNQIPDLDRNLNFIELSLNESGDTDDGDDTDDGIVCRSAAQYCMSCRISRDASRHKSLSRESSFSEECVLSKSPQPAQVDLFRVVVSDLSPNRRSSFTELSDLPSILEPVGEDVDTIETKAKQVVQDEIEKLANFNRGGDPQRGVRRRPAVESC